MHRISKIAAVAALLVLLLTSATPGSQNRVLMRVGGSAATIADHRLLFGSGIQQRQLIDTSLVMLAESLRKLEDARVTLGKTVTEDTFMLGRLMEWGQAITDITRLRTTLRAQTDSAAREKFFRENRNLFRWSEPHFIGSIVFARSPETARQAADSLRKISGLHFSEAEAKAISTFAGKEIRVINYNVARNRNPYVDFAAFNKPDFPEDDRWKAAAVINGKILRQPLCADDAGEYFVTVFADTLLSRWTDSLTTALPVEIDWDAVEILGTISQK